MKVGIKAIALVLLGIPLAILCTASETEQAAAKALKKELINCLRNPGSSAYCKTLQQFYNIQVAETKKSLYEQKDVVAKAFGSKLLRFITEKGHDKNWSTRRTLVKKQAGPILIEAAKEVFGNELKNCKWSFYKPNKNTRSKKRLKLRLVNIVGGLPIPSSLHSTNKSS